MVYVFKFYDCITIVSFYFSIVWTFLFLGHDIVNPFAVSQRVVNCSAAENKNRREAFCWKFLNLKNSGVKKVIAFLEKTKISLKHVNAAFYIKK